MTKPSGFDRSDRTCEVCGTLYKPYLPAQKYCSRKCKIVSVNKTKMDRYHSDPGYHEYINSLSRGSAWRRSDKCKASNAAYRLAHRDEYRLSNKNRNKWLHTHEPWNKALIAARNRSKTVGLPFDLTIEWAKRRWTGICELTGMPFKLGSNKIGALSPSLDRIIPSRGYTQGNCRFVIWAVNAFRRDDDDEMMFTIAEALLAHRAKESAPGSDKPAPRSDI